MKYHKSVILLLALTASLPVMVDYNIVGDDLLLYLAEIEALLGVHIDNAYRLFVVIVNLMTAGVAYLSFTKCFQSSVIGILGSALYTLAPYRLDLLYSRSSVGEYTAMIFLPLLVWGIRGICCFRSKEKGYLWNWVVLGIGLCGTTLPYLMCLDILRQTDNSMTGLAPVPIGSALLLCILLWMGLLLKYGSKELSKTQKTERRIANLALVLGCVMLIANAALMGVAILCMMITACIMGVWLLREERNVLSGKAVLMGVILATLVFGTYQVNHILMISGNIIR